MPTVPPRFVETCASLGFELRSAPLPFIGGMDHAWCSEREAGMVTLRVRAIDGALFVGVCVPSKRRLRCGLRATTIASDASVALPGEQVADHLLPGWQVHAVDPERARAFLERFTAPLRSARDRGTELELTDESLTAWFAGAFDPRSLSRALARTERLAARLDRRAAKVKPPRWLRRVEARWPAFAEARDLDLDPGALTMTGSVRSTATYRGSRERRITVWVHELDHAAPQVGVRVELARVISPAASFTPAEAAQGPWIQQLTGLQAFRDPASPRFAVMAPTEASAAPFLARRVRRALEGLPTSVVRGHVEGAQLEVYAGEVLTLEAALSELVDASVDLAEHLEVHAPVTEGKPEAPAALPVLRPHGVPAQAQEAASRRRAAAVWLVVAAVVAAMLSLGRVV